MAQVDRRVAQKSLYHPPGVLVRSHQDDEETNRRVKESSRNVSAPAGRCFTEGHRAKLQYFAPSTGKKGTLNVSCGRARWQAPCTTTEQHACTYDPYERAHRHRSSSMNSPSVESKFSLAMHRILQYWGFHASHSTFRQRVAPCYTAQVCKHVARRRCAKLVLVHFRCCSAQFFGKLIALQDLTIRDIHHDHLHGRSLASHRTPR